MGAVSSYPIKVAVPADYALGTDSGGVVKRFSLGDFVLNPQTGGNLVRIENTGSAAPAGAAGPGIELIGSSGGSPVIQGYNRTSLAFVPMFYNAGTHVFQINSATISYVDANNTFIYNNFKLVPTTPNTVETDVLGHAPQVLASGGGRVLPRFRTEDGINITAQPHFGRNTIASVQMQGNNNNSTPVGTAALTAVGTVTTRNVATTSRLTRAKRVGYLTTAATAGLACGQYNVAANNQYTVGGAAGAGFMAVFRFAVSDAALVAGAHALIGMRSSTAPPTVTTNPNTLTNVIGVAQNNGSTNWQIVYGGSAAQTPIDTGIAVNITDLLEVIIYARPDLNNKVTVRLENISTGAVYSTVLTGTAGTALPANTTLLGPLLWRSNNATAAQAAIDIANWYVESDI